MSKATKELAVEQQPAAEFSCEGAALVTVQNTLVDLAVNRDPGVVLAEAQRAAAALRDVISRKARPVRFNGEQYLEFEDWQTVARFYGLTARVRSTQYVEYGDAQGFEAAADVLCVSTGRVLTAAEAMCLNDEANWRKKPLFQLRSMSQTRACAKALRNVLSWVVVLAGYHPTPAEEMQGVAGFDTGTGTGKAPAAVKPEAPARPWKTFKGMVDAFAALHGRLPKEHNNVYQKTLLEFGVEHSNQFSDIRVAANAYYELLSRVQAIEASAHAEAEELAIAREDFLEHQEPEASL